MLLDVARPGRHRITQPPARLVDSRREMTVQPGDAAPVTQAGTSGRRAVVQVVGLRETRSNIEIALDEGRRYVIGKGDACDIVLQDPCVSRVHCVLERHGPALFVRDSSSRNGTFLNDRRVECGELTPGTVLGIGLTQLVALGPSGRVRTGFDRLIGNDPALRAAVEVGRRAAETDCSVLIVGETGTGKDVLAQAIHEMSRRAAGPFVALNCGAIPRELIGSELFGHERGAFTGATGERDGVFLQATGGTLFLDELGELPLEQQPHLLRALETRQVRRVGGVGERGFDARVIAATNRDSQLGSAGGALRVDLFHRLATVVIRMPSLRARLGDVEALCAVFLEEQAREYGTRRLSPSARRALREHRWPGNVRELRQAVVRAVAFSTDVIEADHLFPLASRQPLDAIIAPIGPGLVLPDGATPPLPSYDAMVRDAMVEALARHGTMRAAAEALGMAKSTFADRAHRLQIPVPRRVGRP